MRTRRRRTPKTPDQNLDSFLDILTNTVGVLMFVSLFVSLIAVEADSIVKTPLASETEKTPRFFEIKENKVTFVDDAKVGEDIEQVIGNLPNCNRPDYDFDTDSRLYLRSLNSYRNCIASRGRRLTNFRTETEYYIVTMVNPATFSFRYDPIPSKTGEDEARFALPESEFNQVLRELDPQEDYLAFIVRPDSFKSFRAARQ